MLRPGGMYVANLIDYPPLRFVRAEAATLANAFSDVAVIANRRTIEGEGGGNLVLVRERYAARQGRGGGGHRDLGRRCDDGRSHCPR